MSNLLALSGLRQLITNTGARIRLSLTINVPGTCTLIAIADACTLTVAAADACTLTAAADACTLTAT